MASDWPVAATAAVGFCRCSAVAARAAARSRLGMSGSSGLALKPLAFRLPTFATTTVFRLITLPVEFDASRRALRTLEKGGVMPADELDGARRVLKPAALTDVAAFVASRLTLLYWLVRLGMVAGRRQE